MCFETIKPLTLFKGKQILRQRAINNYYNDPNFCLNCGVIIMIPCNTRVADTKVKKFCNRSCSASYNNIGVTRHKDIGK